MRATDVVIDGKGALACRYGDMESGVLSPSVIQVHASASR